MADYHGADFSPQKVLWLVEDLEGYGVDVIEASWRKYRKSDRGRFMPTAFDLIANIQDGRPTAVEAFAMLPHGEDDTVVWTDEMREAWNAAKSHLREKRSSLAYSAFKDRYESLVLEARKNRLEPKWCVSRGISGGSCDAILADAVQKGRISLDYAQQFAPELRGPERLALGHGGKIPELISKTVKTIPKGETDGI